MTKIRVLVAVVLVGALSVVAGPGAQAACGGKNPQVKDAKGDATGFVVESTPGPNQPGLDILTGYLRYDAKKQIVTFTTTVAALQAQGPPPTLGMNWRFGFTFEGGSFQVSALSHTVQGNIYSLGYIRPAGASYSNIVTTLKGAFDTKKSQVRVELPLKVFNAAAKTEGVSKPMKKGSVLTAFSATAQRYIGVIGVGGITPTADVGPGVCIYVVGQA